MSNRIRCIFISMALMFPALCQESKPRWPGVDEVVVEKYADEAGHPSRVPFINTDQGDLLLFCFLVAGAIGGFIAGYSYRSLSTIKQEG